MKIIIGFVFVGLLAGLVPFGLIALARSQPRPSRRCIRSRTCSGSRSSARSGATRCLPTAGRCVRELPGVTASTDLVVHNEMVNDPDDPHMIDHRDAPHRA